MSYCDKVIDLLNRSYSPFHVVRNLKELLLEKGYEELEEKDPYLLKEGGSYFVTRNDSALIAFSVPKNPRSSAFRISASHTDSPTFKIKPNPVVSYKNLISLNVEPYGGLMHAPWLDRPLSFGGRVYYLDSEGRTQCELVAVDEDLLVIPNLCIHFNREMNNGLKYNPAKELIPLAGIGKDFNFQEYLISKMKGDVKEILSFDLFLYNRDKARRVGLHQEFLSSPKLDDLSSTYSVLLGFLEAKPEYFNVYCAFDNEEVGSLTKQGAYGSFLRDTLKRIEKALDLPLEEMIARSLLISVDNAHANHPNYPEISDKTTNVLMNEGIVIKYNANQTYTSDAKSAALLKSIATGSSVKFQDFTNRSDLRGGSTLGNLSNNQISINSVDIGIAQLAMHSCNELCGVEDVEMMAKLAQAFFSSKIQVE